MLYNAEIIEQSEIQNANDVVLKAYNLYKIRFYGTGFKSIPLTIMKVNVNGVLKPCIVYSKTSYLGAVVDIYIFPLQNPIPIAAVLIALGTLTGLTLSIVLLKQVENVSGTLLIIAGVIGYAIYAVKIKKK